MATYNMLDEAIALVAEGFAVIPIHNARELPDGTRVCTCGSMQNCDGKHPRTKFEWATTDKEKIRKFWMWNPSSNFGIDLMKSHCWVLDVDPAGIPTLNGLIEKYGPLPETRIVNTGRGFHYYFTSWAEKIHSFNDGRIGPGLDVKGNSGHALVAAPPSRHYSGRVYSYQKRVPATDAPDWLLTLVKNSMPASKGTSPLTEEQIIARQAYEIPIKRLLPPETAANMHREGNLLVGYHPTHPSRNSPREFMIDLVKNRWTCWWHNSHGGLLELAAILGGVAKCEEFARDNIIKPLSGRNFAKAIQVCLNRGIPAEDLKVHVSGGAYVRQ